MPRARYEKVDSEKKKKLLEAATAEFAAHGYELASINQILETAGFSKGSFYYYFDDKADLASTVFLAVAGPIASFVDFRRPSTAEEFWSELRRTSIERLKLLESKRTEYECAIRLSNALLKDPQLAERLMPMLAASRRASVAFLEQGVSVGALRNDLPLGTLMAIIEAVKTAAYKSIFPADQVPTEAEMESFSDLILDLAKRIAAPSRSV
jgi:AcrR family transcriptional regulator